MKKIYYMILSAMVVSFPQFAFAAGAIATPTGTGLPDDTIVGVLGKVTRFATGLLAVLAILMIVVSGIIYITSGGDQGRVDRAKSMLTYAIIGLIVALLGYVIVKAVSQALGAAW